MEHIAEKLHDYVLDSLYRDEEVVSEYRIAYWFGMFAVAAMVTVAVGILTGKM